MDSARAHLFRPRPPLGRGAGRVSGSHLYKLKSSSQWRLLPVKQFFTGASLTWQGVYARFNAWRKNGSWQGVWLKVLRENGAHLDYSSVQLDGSHTPAKNGG